MEKKLSQFERELMLDEITFYSICPEEDRMKRPNENTGPKGNDLPGL